MRKRAGIEISSKGLSILLNDGERIFMNSLDEFLSSPYSKIESAVAIARDILMVRKWRFPKEALNNVRNAILFNIDDIFPVSQEDLEILYQVLDVQDTYFEVMVMGVKKDLYDTISKVKAVKLILPSAYTLPIFGKRDVYTLRRDKYVEIIRFQDGKLTDWIIKDDLGGEEIDIPHALLEIINKGYKPHVYFIDRRILLEKNQVLYLATLAILATAILLVSSGNYVYWKYKIENMEEKIKKTEPIAMEYNRLIDLINVKKSLIGRIEKKHNCIDLLAKVSETLPKDSWITSFSCNKHNLNIIGYTKTIDIFEKTIKSNFDSIEIESKKTENNIYAYTLRIRL
jgi:hypothetical protein